jgi:hypothetical protein
MRHLQFAIFHPAIVSLIHQGVHDTAVWNIEVLTDKPSSLDSVISPMPHDA